MKKILASIIVGTFPLLTFAQSANIGGVDMPKLIMNIFSFIVPLVVALDIVFLIWSIFQKIIASNDDASSKAKVRIIWSIISLFVIVTLWGFIVTQTNSALSNINVVSENSI